MAEAAKYNVFPLDNRASRASDAATERDRRDGLSSPTRVRCPAFPSAMPPAFWTSPTPSPPRWTIPKGGRGRDDRDRSAAASVAMASTCSRASRLRLQPARSDAFRWEGYRGRHVGRCAAGQAHHRVRLQIRRTRPRQRAARAFSRWMARKSPRKKIEHTIPLLMSDRRDLRRRDRYPHAGE